MTVIGLARRQADRIGDSGRGCLVVVFGVIELGMQGGPELDGGGEESAAFADRLEGAVEVDRAGAPSVAEHPAVFLPEPAHGGGLAGGQVEVVVESVDAFADGVVVRIGSCGNRRGANPGWEDKTGPPS